MRQRCSNYGTGVGPLTISLRWNNWNDLDLHVVTPRQEEIYWCHRTSECGGFLDHDMNVCAVPGQFDRTHSNKPVENCFWEHWPPLGVYQVYVNYYGRHDVCDATEYKVEIMNSGPAGGSVIAQHKGTISESDGKKLICDFVTGVPFSEHCKKAYPSWKIPCASRDEEVSLAGEVQKQQRAFKRIAQRLEAHHKII